MKRGPAEAGLIILLVISQGSPSEEEVTEFVAWHLLDHASDGEFDYSLVFGGQQSHQILLVMCSNIAEHEFIRGIASHKRMLRPRVIHPMSLIDKSHALTHAKSELSDPQIPTVSGLRGSLLRIG